MVAFLDAFFLSAFLDPDTLDDDDDDDDDDFSSSFNKSYTSKFDSKSCGVVTTSISHQYIGLLISVCVDVAELKH